MRDGEVKRCPVEDPIFCDHAGDVEGDVLGCFALCESEGGCERAAKVGSIEDDRPWWDFKTGSFCSVWGGRARSRGRRWR